MGLQPPQGSQTPLLRTLLVRLVSDAEFGPNCWGLLPPCCSTAVGPAAPSCLDASSELVTKKNTTVGLDE